MRVFFGHKTAKQSQQESGRRLRFCAGRKSPLGERKKVLRQDAGNDARKAECSS